MIAVVRVGEAMVVGLIRLKHMRWELTLGVGGGVVWFSKSDVCANL